MFSREIGAQSSTSVRHLICSQTTPARSAGARGGRRGRARLSSLPRKSVRRDAVLRLHEILLF